MKRCVVSPDHVHAALDAVREQRREPNGMCRTDAAFAGPSPLRPRLDRSLSTVHRLMADRCSMRNARDVCASTFSSCARAPSVPRRPPPLPPPRSPSHTPPSLANVGFCRAFSIYPCASPSDVVLVVRQLISPSFRPRHVPRPPLARARASARSLRTVVRLARPKDVAEPPNRRHFFSLWARLGFEKTGRSSC